MKIFKNILFAIGVLTLSGISIAAIVNSRPFTGFIGLLALICLIISLDR